MSQDVAFGGFPLSGGLHVVPRLILSGMLGIAGMRSFDKVKGVATTKTKPGG